MPRIGTNPMKRHGRPWQPRPVTLVTAVHIPELAGYWAESFDVLKVCLESVFCTTPGPYELIVWDNASCEPVRQYLQQLHTAGRVQFLIRSQENVGKVGCWNTVFPGAPGEHIAWFDSDVLFSPGWLEESLRVLHAFPNVGMVTARPGRLPVEIDEDLNAAAAQFANSNHLGLQVQHGDLIPRGVLAEHFASIGVAEESPGYPATDTRLTLGGVSAFAYASHFQFITRREVARKILPLPIGPHPLAGDRQWDICLNEHGFLRLATDQPFVRHLGNSLRGDPAMAAIAHENPIADKPSRKRFPSGIVRRMLVKLNAALTKLIYS